MFQGLRNNSLIYILEKAERPALKIGQVLSVSNPQPKYSYNTAQFGQNLELFVDVKAKVGDEELTLKELPSALSVTERNGVIVADNKEAMLSEVEALVRNSQMVIDSVDYHKGVLESCDSILRELSPQFAKEKEQSEKIVQLESRISNIDKNMGEMMKMLSKAIETPKSK